MTKIGITTILLCFLLTAMASAGESYLCVADLATGFSYNKALDKWEITKFNVDEDKYIVSRLKQKNSAWVWVVRKSGEINPISWCKEDIDQSGYLHCEGVVYFKINIKNLRFMSVYMIGYFDDNIKNDTIKIKEGENTPSITIGKCSPLP